MPNDGMIWGFMMQLGHNMWREAPLYGHKAENGEEYLYVHDRNRVDVEMWNEVTEYVAQILFSLTLARGLRIRAIPNSP